ncbi:hypothetical protein MIMGU_mgv1a020223mg [Erythranthe guttata]|uniref:Xyloglucan endotransglucosylase/hydrolase n=1 Tax=Erythranthe guttata TaxID=4155 RepID=A0A022PW49_ERYGU|nr:hypothetical protein MIMGU_mgv1a020223mg [Erythranthe guttata]
MDKELQSFIDRIRRGWFHMENFTRDSWMLYDSTACYIYITRLWFWYYIIFRVAAQLLSLELCTPYTVHTNIYAKGKGDKEQQFRLWFDPSSAYHTYSILWNPQRIIFLVDNIPIRVFNNEEGYGGRVKTDWTKAPFVASYRNFNVNACVAGSQCGSVSDSNLKAEGANNNNWRTQGPDANGRNRLRWVHQKYIIYNYCVDSKRFPQGIPAECKRSRF